MSDRFPFPDGLYYDRDHHLWVRRNADGQVVVGLDVLGLENLGDLAYVTLHDEGAQVQRGQPMGSLEAAKMTGDLMCPVDGTIVARNTGVLEHPAAVNQDPYGEGWLVVLQPSDWERDAAALVSGDDVAPWVDAEIARMREEGWID